MAHYIRSRTITFSHEKLAAPVSLEHDPGESLVQAAITTPGDDGADGTNLRLWPTSLILSRFLCDHPEYVVGKRVVELGSGSGAVGIVCSMLGAACVTLTDVPDALPLITRNAERNPPPANTHVQVLPCTWGERTQIEAVLGATSYPGSLEGSRGYDVILCCEVVYQQNAEVLTALAQTQRALECCGAS